MKLILTNSLGGQKEIFRAIKEEEKEVKVYVCGITPYDYAHLGHGRLAVNFDVLVRVLKLLEYKVTYVRNITDIDDKIISKAYNETGDIYNYKNISQKFYTYFDQDLKRLNCLKPDIEPKVTDNIKKIISFIQELIESKKAYILDHDVYFDISSFPGYGKLSGKKLEDLIAGARVEANINKQNPGDFALWKGNNEKLFWESPWGYGRPGWHIECSVLAEIFLGKTLDIHGGGQDLIFPHHENEIAQSESLHNCPLAHYWLHNAFVNINKEKMSKSLGNFLTIRDVFEKYDPMALRFYFLQHNYRTPIEFGFDDLEACSVAYKKLVNNLKTDSKDFELIILQELLKYNFLKECIESLLDDLNTPKVLGIIFKNLSDIEKSQELILITRYFIKNILGLTLENLKEQEIEITPEIKKLLEEREKARLEKNWALSDTLRDKLKELGYNVQDKKVK